MFDSSATATILNRDDFMCPEPRDYFPTLIEYAVAKNFGRPLRKVWRETLPRKSRERGDEPLDERGNIRVAIRHG